MKLLELPLEVFRLIIANIVKELGLKKALRIRPVSRFFASEIWDAIFTTRVIEGVVESYAALLKVRYRLDIITRYLEFRVLAVGGTPHPWIAEIRAVAQAVAQHMGCGNDLDKKIELQRHACACLAANAQHFVFEHMRDRDNPRSRLYAPPAEVQHDVRDSIVTIAAWMGDLDLVKSLHRGADSVTNFGRPSWAAATNGHVEVLRFLFEKGALPYEPTYTSGPSFALCRSALAAAAYMGHEDIVKLHLAQPYYASGSRPTDGWREVGLGCYWASHGDQPGTLRLLLQYVKEHETDQEYLATLDWSLICSCTRGALNTARAALDLGADIKETDLAARSCLQLAAKTGNVELVELLLNAGVEIEASDMQRRRAFGRETPMRKQKDALFEARKRNYPKIVKLIEERKKIIAAQA